MGKESKEKCQEVIGVYIRSPVKEVYDYIDNPGTNTLVDGELVGIT